jgi:AcrR family transcriptional regulator
MKCQYVAVKDLRTTIMEAAVQVFMRYGVGRTRMSDIAAEAGVVRQTLYSFFTSKDDILCATIRHVSELSLAEIKREWESQEKLEDKIDTFYEHAIITSFSMINASPDARDMIDGYNASGKAELEHVQADKISAWNEILAKHPTAREKLNVPTVQMAEFIVLASLGLRDQVSDEKQLRKMLEIQKTAILALLG